MSDVIHRFTLGGYTDEDLGVQLLKDYIEPLAPGTFEKWVQIPGRDGAYDYGADFLPRKIVLRLCIVDAAAQPGGITARQNLASLLRTIAGILIGTDGKPQDLVLTFDEKESGKSYTVRFVGRQPDVERTAEALGVFELEFMAYDPFAYAAEESQDETVTTSPREITVENEGTAPTPPVITIVNNGSNTISGLRIERTSP